MRRPAAAEGTPTRAKPEKKRKPDTPSEAQPKKPKPSADAKNKPRMPTDGEKVYYRGATVDECCQPRDLYWRIKFPSGTIKSRTEVTVFMCTYMCIYI